MNSVGEWIEIIPCKLPSNVGADGYLKRYLFWYDNHAGYGYLEDGFWYDDSRTDYDGISEIVSGVTHYCDVQGPNSVRNVKSVAQAARNFVKDANNSAEYIAAVERDSAAAIRAVNEKLNNRT